MTKILGGIDIIEQKGLTGMPQKAQSAFDGALGSMVGASYKPLAYVAKQQVKGVNRTFIAEQTFATSPVERHIVLVTINDFDGNYSIVNLERII